MDHYDTLSQPQSCSSSEKACPLHSVGQQRLKLDLALSYLPHLVEKKSQLKIVEPFGDMTSVIDPLIQWMVDNENENVVGLSASALPKTSHSVACEANNRITAEAAILQRQDQFLARTVHYSANMDLTTSSDRRTLTDWVMPQLNSCISTHRSSTFNSAGEKFIRPRLQTTQPVDRTQTLKEISPSKLSLQTAKGGLSPPPTLSAIMTSSQYHQQDNELLQRAHPYPCSSEDVSAFSLPKPHQQYSRSLQTLEKMEAKEDKQSKGTDQPRKTNPNVSKCSWMHPDNFSVVSVVPHNGMDVNVEEFHPPTDTEMIVTTFFPEAPSIPCHSDDNTSSPFSPISMESGAHFLTAALHDRFQSDEFEFHDRSRSAPQPRNIYHPPSPNQSPRATGGTVLNPHELKRIRNTESARRCRQRRAERMKEMELQVAVRLICFKRDLICIDVNRVCNRKWID